MSRHPPNVAARATRPGADLAIQILAANNANSHVNRAQFFSDPTQMSLTLTLSDDLLRQAGMTPEEARIEIACRLFDAEKLALWPAAQLAQLSRVEFEGELMKRKIPIYRLTPDDLKADLATLERLESLDKIGD